MATDAEHAEFFAQARKMGDKLGLTPGTLEKMLEAEDWAFCVQAFCVVEICVNRILEQEIKTNWRQSKNQEALDKFWSNLPLNGRGGRVRLLNDLELLSPPYVKFIEMLSFVRNRYCHDARMLNLSIPEIIFSEDPNLVRSRRNQLCTIEVTDDSEPVIADTFSRTPKFAIWMSLMSLLGFAHLREEYRPQSLFSLALSDGGQKEGL